MSKSSQFLLNYFDYTNVFSSDSMAKLSKHTGINNHLINLVDDSNLQLKTGKAFQEALYSYKSSSLQIKMSVPSEKTNLPISILLLSRG